ncbi:MAG: TetR/AcrR family transcriptional regulator [Eubacteriales bacterium]|nr:TetR/AcrR family transcriptional regulator [Eubacteriales bacterium]MDY5346388.1 TetR/AcrR family transcriptional regulator [Eubacteriales bacterium]
MASFTKKAIVQTFLKLLDDRPLNQITVKDIVEACGINRNSFYYHFEDLPSLMEEILKDEADRIINEHASVSSLEDCLCVAIDFALKHKRAVMHTYGATNRALYEQYLDRVSQYVVSEYVNMKFKEIPADPADKELLIHFFKCILIGGALDWIADGMRYDIRQHVRRLCLLFDGTVEEALHRSADMPNTSADAAT